MIVSIAKRRELGFEYERESMKTSCTSRRQKAVAIRVLVAVSTASGAVRAQSASGETHSYIPLNGFVPDSATAVAIAETVLRPIYGVVQVKSEEPFRVSLANGVWKVEGTLYCGPKGNTESCVGGVALVEIDKKSGRIILLTHGK